MRIELKKSHQWLSLCMVVIFAGFICFGCNSGGDGDSNPNAMLDGDYYMSVFGNSGTDHWVQINDSEFDGAGGLSANLLYDSDGDTGTYTNTYEMDADGSFVISDSDVTGSLSQDGYMMALVDTDPTGVDTEIIIGAALAASAGSDETLLNGKFIFCQIRQDGKGMMGTRLSATFDGLGGWTGSILADTDDGPGEALVGTYTVASDGRFEMDITGLTKTFDGVVAPDGNSVVIIDDDTDPEVLLMVGMKTSSGNDLTSLSGDFQVFIFGGDTTSTWSSLADATADGQGNISFDTVAASDGDMSSGTMSYTVDSDGTLTFPDTDEAGIVAPSGDMFVVGFAEVGTEASIVLGIKKM